MIKMKPVYRIPVENIYRMLQYVFDGLDEEQIGELEPESFTNLPELLAELLIRSINRQLQFGLYRYYVAYEEPLTVIRGKVDMNRTIRLKTQLNRQLYCQYDEFSKNNFYNQILKSTLLFLMRQARVCSDTRKRIKNLIFALNDIDELPLRSVVWDAIRYNKDKFAYRTHIGLCYLCYKGLEEEVEGEVSHYALKPKEMYELYENFMPRFFAKEDPHLHISFQGKNESAAEDDKNNSERPMIVDMSIRYRKHKMIISSHYDDDRLLLIQHDNKWIMDQISRLYIIAKRSKFNVKGKLSALFLFPSIEESYLEQYPVEDYDIYIGALNFTLPFEQIREQLLMLIEIIKQQ